MKATRIIPDKSTSPVAMDLKPSETCGTACPVAQRSVTAVVNTPESKTLDKTLSDDTSLKLANCRSPRYTSYPSADRFVEAFGPNDYARHLGARELYTTTNLSLYAHIPFCQSLCYYCGCNKTVTQNKSKSLPYVWRLIDELAMVNEHLSGERQVSQLHLGGGTPTFLDSYQIQQLMQALRNYFDFNDKSELSIEIDPRALKPNQLSALADEGFNRISIGVQDFDHAVQQAINRVQPTQLTVATTQRARSLGFKSINYDLIYGLPLQSVNSFEKTLHQVIELKPDRIAMYNYAHMPSLFTAQRMINESDLPSPKEREAIFEMSSELLEAAGYIHIGMDHFALPDDELATAYRNGCLHRNFQGYTTQSNTDLIGLGASAISQMGACYSQNRRGVNEYVDRINQGSFATQRGIELTRDDFLRRSLIMAIMCQGQVYKPSIEAAYLIKFDSYFLREMEKLQPLSDMGYVQLSDDSIVVTETGKRQALRMIAAVFDKYLQQQTDLQSYSRVL